MHIEGTKRSVKSKIAWCITVIMLVIGGAACFGILLHEQNAIIRKFEHEHTKASALLAQMITRDVMTGNYYSSRIKLAEYARYGDVESLLLCLNNGESMIILQSSNSEAPSCEQMKQGFAKTLYVVAATIEFKDVSFGKVIVGYRTSKVESDVARIRISVIGSFVFIMSVAIGLLLIAVHYAVGPIMKYIEWMKNISMSDNLLFDNVSEHAPLTKEEHDLRQAFTAVLDKYRSVQDEKRKESLMAAIGQMSSHMAHDMRSPLSVLKAYVGLNEVANDDENDEYKAAATRSVEKLLRMADGLVDYAKANKIERKHVVFEEFFHQSVMMETYDKALERGVEIRYEADEAIHVNIDAHKIERVLVNLVNNAVQSISLSQGEVVVKARIQEGSDLIVSIVDNGVGIGPEHLPHVFDSFFTAGKKGGTGLGLSYCKQVIEAHGGTVEVGSVVGRGTAFTIHIPNCVVSNFDKRITQDEAWVKREYGVTKEVTKKFLVVDDDADVRRQWERIVGENGGRIIHLATSAEEVQKDSSIDYSKLDAAIVDYHYEGFLQTGIDLIEFLKRRGVREIHLCTGFHRDDDIRRRAAEAGADSIIPKPIDEGGVSRLF